MVYWCFLLLSKTQDDWQTDDSQVRLRCWGQTPGKARCMEDTWSLEGAYIGPNDCGRRLACLHSYTLLGLMSLLTFTLMWEAQMWTSPAFPLGAGLTRWMTHADLAMSWPFLVCSASTSGKPNFWTGLLVYPWSICEWIKLLLLPGNGNGDFLTKPFGFAPKNLFLNRSICPLSFLFYYLWLRWVVKRLKHLRTTIKRRHWQVSGGPHL